MPTIPLMTLTSPAAAAHSDAPRLVTAPGGYEWWGFDASADDGRLHVVAAIHAGHAFDTRSLRKYALYRRWPTRVRPPVPKDHFAVTFALLEAGRPALWFAASVAAAEFTATDDGRSVRLGASHFDCGADGVLRLQLRGQNRHRTIAVNLSFRPQIEARCEIDLVPALAESNMTPPASRLGQHGWVVTNPLCDVDGQISVFETDAAAPPRVTPFAGSGCHDRRFGTRPLSEAADRWMSGRAVFEDRALLFQQIGDASFVCYSVVKEQTTHIRADASIKTTGGGANRWGVGFPETIELPAVCAGGIKLMRPRVVGSSFATVTVAYDAVGDSETGRALVRCVRARRLIVSP